MSSYSFPFTLEAIAESQKHFTASRDAASDGRCVVTEGVNNERGEGGGGMSLRGKTSPTKTPLLKQKFVKQTILLT